MISAHKLCSHRVGRVLSFFSSRWNWDSQTPHPQASVLPPPLWSRGEGESQFRRGVIHCSTLYILFMYFVSVPIQYYTLSEGGWAMTEKYSSEHAGFADSYKQLYVRPTYCSIAYDSSSLLFKPCKHKTVQTIQEKSDANKPC